MNKNFQQQVVTRDLTKFSKIYLVPLADLHIGCKDANVKVIRKYIDWIKEHKNAFTILNGDLMNCATKDSTPELYDDLITPDQSYNRLKILLEPIKDRILMITRGGHEGQIYRRVGADYMARLAWDLGDIPYKPDGGMVGIWLSRADHNMTFWTYATHGWGGARKTGGKANKIEELTNAVYADCYVLSHDHTQIIHRFNTLEPPKSRCTPKRAAYMHTHRRLLVNTGGFINYAGYIQSKGYTPQDIGTPRVLMEIKANSKGERYKDLHASL